MNWDTFFRVWAVLGPLLAAAASAVWSRRVQVQDREHEHSRDVERLDRTDAAKKVDHLRTVRLEKYNETKGAIADFMASSHEYVRKQSDYMTDPIPNKHQSASLANDKFVYSCQLVMLLGDEQLSGSATALWNATITIPKSYSTPIDQSYEQKLAIYRSVRVAFNEQARNYLRSLDAQEV